MIIRMQTKTFVGGGKHDWGKNPLSADTPFKEIDCISAVWPEKSEKETGEGREHWPTNDNKAHKICRGAEKEGLNI